MKWLFLFLLTAAWVNEFSCVFTSFRVVCYYGSLSAKRDGEARFLPSNIDPRLCTDFVYAFAQVTGNSVKPIGNAAQQYKLYAQMADLKKGHSYKNVFLSVTNWKWKSVNYEQLANAIVPFLRLHKFDGLDISSELPSKYEIQYYSQCIQTIRQAFEKEASLKGVSRLLLTSRLTRVGQSLDNYNVTTINTNLDWINLMTFDFHKKSPSQNPHHHSLLFPTAREPSRNIQTTVNRWVKQGFSVNKIYLGVAFFARTFLVKDVNRITKKAETLQLGSPGQFTKTKGLLAYSEVCQLKRPEKTVNGIDGPYVVSDTLWAGYDNQQSVSLKVKWAIENGLGGVSVWSVDLDDFTGKFCGQGPFPLLLAINIARQSMLNTALTSLENQGLSRREKGINRSVHTVDISLRARKPFSFSGQDMKGSLQSGDFSQLKGRPIFLNRENANRTIHTMDFSLLKGKSVSPYRKTINGSVNISRLKGTLVSQYGQNVNGSVHTVDFSLLKRRPVSPDEQNTNGNVNFFNLKRRPGSIQSQNVNVNDISPLKKRLGSLKNTVRSMDSLTLRGKSGTRNGQNINGSIHTVDFSLLKRRPGSLRNPNVNGPMHTVDFSLLNRLGSQINTAQSMDSLMLEGKSGIRNGQNINGSIHTVDFSLLKRRPGSLRNPNVNGSVHTVDFSLLNRPGSRINTAQSMDSLMLKGKSGTRNGSIHTVDFSLLKRRPGSLRNANVNGSVHAVDFSLLNRLGSRINTAQSMDSLMLRGKSGTQNGQNINGSIHTVDFSLLKRRPGSLRNPNVNGSVHTVDFSLLKRPGSRINTNPISNNEQGIGGFGQTKITDLLNGKPGSSKRQNVTGSVHTVDFSLLGGKRKSQYRQKANPSGSRSQVIGKSRSQSKEDTAGSVHTVDFSLLKGRISPKDSKTKTSVHTVDMSMLKRQRISPPENKVKTSVHTVDFSMLKRKPVSPPKNKVKTSVHAADFSMLERQPVPTPKKKVKTSVHTVDFSMFERKPVAPPKRKVNTSVHTVDFSMLMKKPPTATTTTTEPSTTIRTTTTTTPKPTTTPKTTTTTTKATTTTPKATTTTKARTTTAKTTEPPICMLSREELTTIKPQATKDDIRRVRLAVILKKTTSLQLVTEQKEIPRFLHFCKERQDDFYNHWNKCGKYILCINGSTFVGTCAQGLKFNLGSVMCEEDITNTCTDSPELSVSTKSQPVLKLLTPKEMLFKDFCIGKPDDYYAHPVNCKFYVLCVKEEYFLGHCQPGYYFNPQLNLCDKSKGKSCLEVTSKKVEKRVDQPTIARKCKGIANGKYPYPRRCNLFILCLDQRMFIGICQQNAHFSPELKMCDYSTRLDCKDKDGPPALTNQVMIMAFSSALITQISLDDKCKNIKNGEYVHPTKCNLFIFCFNQRMFMGKCPGDSLFSEITRTCEAAPNVDCSANRYLHGSSIRNNGRPGKVNLPSGQYSTLDDNCEGIADGEYPHPTQCDQFILCFNKQRFLGICPKGSLFSTMTRMCVQPENSDCKVITPRKGLVKQPTFDGKCKGVEDGQYLHPTQCTMFILCFRQKMLLGICPGGRFFSQNSQRCEESATVNCDDKSIKASIDQARWDSLILMQNAHIVVPILNVELPTLPHFEVNLKKFCLFKDDGLYQHPQKCHAFIQCSNWRTLIRHCPGKLNFNIQIKKCDYSYSVHCLDEKQVTISNNGSGKQQLTSKHGTHVEMRDKSQNYGKLPVSRRFPTPYGNCENIKDGFYPHHTECSRFLLCSNQQMFIGICPQGKMFSVKSKICENSEVVQCKGDVFPSLTDQINLEWKITEEIKSQLLYISQQTSVIIIEFQNSFRRKPVVDGNCKGVRNGEYRHPSECGLFTLCFNQEMYIGKCPGNKLFSLKSKLCEHPTKVDCNDYLTDTIPDATALGYRKHSSTEKYPVLDGKCQGIRDGEYPHPTRCDQFILCHNEFMYIGICPKGSFFSNTLNTCDYATNSNCEDPISSQDKTFDRISKQPTLDGHCRSIEDGEYPHPSKCSMFILCFNQKMFFGVCPNGHDFSSTSGMCENSAKVNCKDSYRSGSDQYKWKNLAVLNNIYVIVPTLNRFISAWVDQKKSTILSECIYKEDGLYPHPQRCDSFVQCSEWQSFVRICPNRLHFNPNTKRCDYPDNVVCTVKDRARLVKDRAHLVTDDYNNFVKTPKQQSPDSNNVLKGTRFPVTEKNRVKSSQKYPTLQDQCQGIADGEYPHPHECNKFILCFNQQMFFGNCPQGTLFSFKARFCDHQENVDCTNRLPYNTVKARGKDAPSFDKTRGKDASSFDKTRGKDAPSFDKTRGKDAPSFDKTRGKDAPSFDKTRGKDAPSFDKTRGKDAPSFDKTRGKDAPSFDKTRGKDAPSFDKTRGKDAPSFDKTRGKDAPSFDKTRGKDAPSFDKTRGKDAPSFDKTRGKDAPSFDKTRGKDAPSFDKTRGKDAPSFDKTRGKDAPSFDKTRGKDAPSFDKTRGKDAPSFDKTRGKDAPSFDKTRGKDAPSFDKTRGKDAPSFDKTRGKDAPSVDKTRGKEAPSVASKKPQFPIVPEIHVKPSAKQPTLEENCQGIRDGEYPHPTKCGFFILCFQQRLFIGKCPGDTLFSTVSNSCTNPSEVNCKAKNRLEEKVSTLQASSTIDKSTSTRQPTLDGNCKNLKDGEYPHPTKCALFILCFNQNMFIGKCQSGTLFSAKSKKCDLPVNVDCKGRLPDEPNTLKVEQELTHHISKNKKLHLQSNYEGKCVGVANGQYPHPTQCAMFILCFNQKVLFGICPGGRLFSPKTRMCDDPVNVNCKVNSTKSAKQKISPEERKSSVVVPNLIASSSRHFDKMDSSGKLNDQSLCLFKEDGMYEHPYECNLYLQCSNWQTFVKMCPEKLNFNSKINRCDYSHNVVCRPDKKHYIRGRYIKKQPSIPGMDGSFLYGKQPLVPGRDGFLFPGMVNYGKQPRRDDSGVYGWHSQVRGTDALMVPDSQQRFISDKQSFVPRTGDSSVSNKQSTIPERNGPVKYGKQLLVPETGRVSQPGEQQSSVPERPGLLVPEKKPIGPGMDRFLVHERQPIVPERDIPLVPDKPSMVPGIDGSLFKTSQKYITPQKYPTIEGQCKGVADGEYPHPHKCNKFILCFNQQMFFGSCPQGTLFSFKARFCDHQENVNCIDQSLMSPNGESLNNKVTEQYNDKRSRIVPNVQTQGFLHGSCSGLSDGEYPYPLKCELFILCFNQQMFIGKCHKGRLFSVTSRKCADPTTVDCNGKNRGIHVFRDTSAPSSQNSSPLLGNCEGVANGEYPHPTRCNQFILCFSQHLYIGRCPKGHLFSQESRICKEAAKVNCSDRSPTAFNSGTTKKINTGPNRDMTSVKSQQATLNGSCEGVQDGQYPHPAQCSMFILCFQQKMLLGICPGGKFFSPQSKMCEDHKNVNCKDDNILRKQFLAKMKNQQISSVVPSVEDYSQIPVERNPSASKLSVQSECIFKADGLYPHPHHCDSFIQCSEWQTFIKNCPNNLYFNPNSNQCDYPNNVTCTGRGPALSLSPQKIFGIKSVKGLSKPYIPGINTFVTPTHRPVHVIDPSIKPTRPLTTRLGKPGTRSSWMKNLRKYLQRVGNGGSHITASRNQPWLYTLTRNQPNVVLAPELKNKENETQSWMEILRRNLQPETGNLGRKDLENGTLSQSWIYTLLRKIQNEIMVNTPKNYSTSERIALMYRLMRSLQWGNIPYGSKNVDNQTKQWISELTKNLQNGTIIHDKKNLPEKTQPWRFSRKNAQWSPKVNEQKNTELQQWIRVLFNNLYNSKASHQSKDNIYDPQVLMSTLQKFLRSLKSDSVVLSDLPEPFRRHIPKDPNQRILWIENLVKDLQSYIFLRNKSVPQNGQNGQKNGHSQNGQPKPKATSKERNLNDDLMRKFYSLILGQNGQTLSSRYSADGTSWVDSSISTHQMQSTNSINVCLDAADGFYIHPTNSYMYIKCQKQRMTLLHCPKGQKFDCISLRCRVNAITCRVEDTNKKKPSTYEKHSSSFQDSSRGSNIKLSHETRGIDYCAGVKDGAYIYPSKCNRFLLCSNGRAFLETCPAGLLFNPILKRCDYLQNVNCIERRPLQEVKRSSSADTWSSVNTFDINEVCKQRRDGYYTHPLTCNEYIICFGKQSYQRTCPSGLHFDATTERCDYANKVKCRRKHAKAH